MAARLASRRRAPILLLLALLLSLAGCSSERSPAGPSPAGPAVLERQAHAAVNQHRASIGLPALAWNDSIADVARRHSQDMASGAVPFGHAGFDARLAAIGATIPWQSAGENVAVSSSVASAVQGWLNSPGHRENIEGSFGLTGVGAATAGNGTIYLTQIFIR